MGLKWNDALLFTKIDLIEVELVEGPLKNHLNNEL